MDSSHNAELDELTTVRSRALQTFRTPWFPFLLFGTLTLLSAPLIWFYGTWILGPFWGIAGPLGGISTGAYYRRKGRQVGIEGRPGRHIAIGTGIVLGGFAAVGLGSVARIEILAGIGPALALAGGLLAHAIVSHTNRFAYTTLGAALAAASVTLWALGWGVVPTLSLLSASYGIAALGLGSFYLAKETTEKQV